jgi:hypothetical protein
MEMTHAAGSVRAWPAASSDTTEKTPILVHGLPTLSNGH